ncbi:hypothetical protein MNBD_GAMMA07-1351 [hydrothermal vent metagenome]|uniref:TIGR02444 family protein n=1 Tax=hydrothermal vent metagenome TaxID=652676 RepID=A0A3B0XM49_9ZZZZ
MNRNLRLLFMDFPNSEFWNYSAQIWSLPEVETLCLNLQNNHAINVNILLYCYWIGAKKCILNEDDIQILLDTAQPWQTIIAPLRDSRKMMQQHLVAMPANMRKQTVFNINEMEINAEHMTQIALEKALNLENITPYKNHNDIECSFNNVKIYLDSLENETTIDEITRQIIELHMAIFQDKEAVQVATMSCI